MKTNFFINIKYGIISYRYYITILIVLTFFLGIIIAYNNSINFYNWYVNYTHQPNPSQSDINITKMMYIYDFWNNLSVYMALFILPISSFITSNDEENDMNKYLLLYKLTRSSLYFSKVVIMLIISFLISIVVWLSYGALFSNITGFSVWYINVFLAIFVLYFIAALLGSIIGISAKRKSWGIIISIFLVIFLIYIGNNAYMQGIEIASMNHNIHTISEFRSAIPLTYKMLAFLWPGSLTEILYHILRIPQTMDNLYQISILSFYGDIYVYIAWISILTITGYIIFFLRHVSSVEVRKGE